MKEVLVKKQEEVAKISEKFKNSCAVVAFKYQGLTVKRFQELRREVRAAGVEVAVIKNNISRRAASDNGYGEDFTNALSGPIALAFAENDVVAPAKILFKQYAVEGNTLEVINGIVDGDVYDFNQLKQLSVLPSYETLLTQLAAGMLGTVSQLAIGLNMLVEKGEEAQA